MDCRQGEFFILPRDITIVEPRADGREDAITCRAPYPPLPFADCDLQLFSVLILEINTITRTKTLSYSTFRPAGNPGPLFLVIALSVVNCVPLKPLDVQL